jgi:glycerol-3-phosphate acyltransferase PlsX
MLKIGVDLMGNENSPEALLAALKNMILPSGVELVAFGLPEFEKIAGIPYVATQEYIASEDPPLISLRRKKEASLSVGLRQLKAKKIDAFVSAGNTGALVSGAKMILGNLPGILRPALLARIPTKKHPLIVLDVGAVVQAKAAHLIQFSLLGAAFSQTQGIDKPTVGLLNIGSEPLKGTSELREAYQHLKSMKNPPFSFAGNIEGKSVFEGHVDILITEGFTGNIFLKTAEGIASLILDRFGTLLPANEYQKIHSKIEDLQQNLHYAQNPGAILIGVQGIVIKCHGYSTPQGFANGIAGAADLLLKDFSGELKKQMDKANYRTFI